MHHQLDLGESNSMSSHSCKYAGRDVTSQYDSEVLLYEGWGKRGAPMWLAEQPGVLPVDDRTPNQICWLVLNWMIILVDPSTRSKHFMATFVWELFITNMDYNSKALPRQYFPLQEIRWFGPLGGSLIVNWETALKCACTCHFSPHVAICSSSSFTDTVYIVVLRRVLRFPSLLLDSTLFFTWSILAHYFKYEGHWKSKAYSMGCAQGSLQLVS